MDSRVTMVLRTGLRAATLLAGGGDPGLTRLIAGFGFPAHKFHSHSALISEEVPRKQQSVVEHDSVDKAFGTWLFIPTCWEPSCKKFSSRKQYLAIPPCLLL